MTEEKEFKVYIERVDGSKEVVDPKNTTYLKNLTLAKGDQIVWDSLWNGTEFEKFAVEVKVDGKKFTDYVPVLD